MGIIRGDDRGRRVLSPDAGGQEVRRMAHILDEIKENRDEIYSIARKYNVEKIYVFGSCARREERPDSDIDFIVDFASTSKFGDQVDVSDAFFNYFGRKVDVVSSNGISPHIKRFIWKEAVAV